MFRFALFLVLVYVGAKAFAYGDALKSPTGTWCQGGGPGSASSVCAASPGAVYDAVIPKLRKSACDGYVTCEAGGSPNCVVTPQASGDAFVCTGVKSRGGYSNGAGGFNYDSWVEHSAAGKYYVSDACPSNSATNDLGYCQCFEGFKPSPDKKSCQAYECPSAGSHNAFTEQDVEMTVPGNVCNSGCSATPSSIKVAKDGKMYGSWPFKYTGDHCGGDKAPDTQVETGEGNWKDPPMRCGAGQCPGAFNGAALCVPCANERVPGPSETASSPTGPTVDNPDRPGIDGVTGAVEKRQDTSCTGLTCTITTTYIGPSGQKVGEKTQEKPKDSFCAENPNLQICKSGKWGGSCGPGFTCDGDPVQCAMAREQHVRNCQWYELDSKTQAAADTGATAMASGSRPEGHPFAAAEEKSLNFASAIDTTERFAAGCPSDQTFDVAGYAFSIPFSQLCGSLNMLGSALVGLTFLACLSIVFRQ